MDSPLEQWQITKPVVRSDQGIVAAQNARAAAVGAEILRAGGNAVDAAVATGFALSAVEPWMSGLGGGGYMLVYLAEERRVHAVDFAMVAPRFLDPAAFPLAGGGRDRDLFGWPAVEDERNGTLVVHPYRPVPPSPATDYVVAVGVECSGTVAYQADYLTICREP